MPQVLQTYKPVTAERLKNPDAGDWLMVRRTWDGWGYSPLDQITPANVARLQPAWVVSTGVTNGHEAPPIVNNGVMFVATPGNQVIALDAKTGGLLWRYKRPLAEDVVLLHGTSRGVALFGNKVFFAAAEAVLVALDATTGKEVWTATVEDNRKGYYMSVAPLVANGKVMVGASGGEMGVRGFVAAYDVETGKQAWKTFTVPAPGEPGSETWPKGEQWKTGGGSIWVTGAYDPDTNLAFWGTGNGGPWMGDQRPGDNLYTSSTIALDATTGAIKGHFQYDPNDSWDWDEVSPPILVDYTRGGKTVKGLIDVARDGYLWFLERTAGTINFVDGTPYVKQNVFKSLDPKTGRPDIDPARRPGTGKEAEFCPSHWGGKNWPPIAYSPKTRMIYIPGQREPLRPHRRAPGHLRRRAGASPARPACCSSRRAPITSAKCRRGTSTPASACGRTRFRSPRTGARCWPPAAASSSAAAPRIACSAPSTRRPASCSGNSRPTPASSGSRRRSWSTASNTSPCSPAGASTRRRCRGA